jgi:hypothetical protein
VKLPVLLKNGGPLNLFTSGAASSDLPQIEGWSIFIAADLNHNRSATSMVVDQRKLGSNLPTYE